MSEKNKREQQQCCAEFTSEEYLLLDSLCLNPSPLASSNPEQQAMLRDLAAKILLQLSPQEQMILTLMAVEGLSVEEVARLCGATVIATRVRAYRARKHAMNVLKSLSKTRPAL